jgi:hypothetical protein
VLDAGTDSPRALSDAFAVQRGKNLSDFVIIHITNIRLLKSPKSTTASLISSRHAAAQLRARRLEGMKTMSADKTIAFGLAALYCVAVVFDDRALDFDSATADPRKLGSSDMAMARRRRAPRARLESEPG